MVIPQKGIMKCKYIFDCCNLAYLGTSFLHGGQWTTTPPRSAHDMAQHYAIQSERGKPTIGIVCGLPARHKTANVIGCACLGQPSRGGPRAQMPRSCLLFNHGWLFSFARPTQALVGLWPGNEWDVAKPQRWRTIVVAGVSLDPCVPFITAWNSANFREKVPSTNRQMW